MFSAGEHENEGDDRKGAQSQAPPSGVSKPPKGIFVPYDFKLLFKNKTTL